MNYGKINFCDVANGPGIRVSLFVSGCRNHCPGCFQPETWDFDYGKLYTTKEEAMIFDALDSPNVFGLTLVGCDPMEPENIPEIRNLCVKVRRNYGDSKTIWLYTGYTFESLRKRVPDDTLRLLDVMVDGPFIESKKVFGEFRGSSNQRFIDVKETLRRGRMVLWDLDSKGGTG